jgi:CBS domain-containing protein
MLVSDILRVKGSHVFSVRPDERIATVAVRIQQEQVGAMIVSEDGEALDGIISERDLAHGIALYGAGLLEMRVSDLMTKAVVTCAPDDSVSDVARVMTQRHIRHLPVKDGDRLAGVVSVRDVVKHRLDELQMEANVLRDYVIARQ